MALRHAAGRNDDLQRELGESNERSSSLERALGISYEKTTGLEVEQARFAEELALAQVVQRSFLPRGTSFEGVRLFSHLESAGIIGGDLYDIVAHPDRLVCIVADVAGKGVAAALLMSLSVAILREAVRAGDEPSAMLERANALLREYTPNQESRFVSASIAVFDTRTHTVAYSSAGHEEAVLWNGSRRRSHLLWSTGPLLGLFEGAQYGTTTVNLRPGDRLIQYTDGVVDARGPRRARYGQARLLRSIKRHGCEPVADMGRLVLRDLDTFRHGAVVNDDTTLLVGEFS